MISGCVRNGIGRPSAGELSGAPGAEQAPLPCGAVARPAQLTRLKRILDRQLSDTPFVGDRVGACHALYTRACRSTGRQGSTVTPQGRSGRTGPVAPRFLFVAGSGRGFGKTLAVAITRCRPLRVEGPNTPAAISFPGSEEDHA